MPKRYYVYILANERNTVLYTGVTDDVVRRVNEHRSDMTGTSFTSRYHVQKLVHVEETGDVNEAIAREKQIKGWVRAKKVELIEQNNPGWVDLLSDGTSVERDSSPAGSE